MGGRLGEQSVLSDRRTPYTYALLLLCRWRTMWTSPRSAPCEGLPPGSRGRARGRRLPGGGAGRARVAGAPALTGAPPWWIPRLKAWAMVSGAGCTSCAQCPPLEWRENGFELKSAFFHFCTAPLQPCKHPALRSSTVRHTSGRRLQGEQPWGAHAALWITRAKATTTASPPGSRAHTTTPRQRRPPRSPSSAAGRRRMQLRERRRQAGARAPPASRPPPARARAARRPPSAAPRPAGATPR